MVTGNQVVRILEAIEVLRQRTGRDIPAGTVEVVSGLSSAARIVDNPPDSIAPGELVRVGEGGRG